MREPDLTSYDWIVVNSSAGKDSQAMLDYVYEQAAGLHDRLVVVHCNLGRVEWQGTLELAERQVRNYGLRFEVVRREGGDLLDQVLARGKWPSSTCRYCTSDQKRDQVAKLHTRLAREKAGLGRPVRILNCLGMRQEESPARAKLLPFAPDRRLSNGRKQVDNWLPIHGWKLAQVWQRIKASGVEHHWAYDIGMPRLSCVFCIFAPRAALLLAAKHNRQLLEEYVQVELTIGHTFRKELPIARIKQALDAGEVPQAVQDWAM